MPQAPRKISLILRITGATLFAIVLWGIVSLSGRFDTTIDVPLGVETPADRALVEPIPAALRVSVRANGWSLLKILATGRADCLLRPQVRGAAEEMTIGYGQRDLLASLRSDLPDVQQLRVSPDTLTLVLGPVERKSVALVPEATINTRKGFEVIGGLHIEPDSITLVGAKRVLNQITSWPTAPLLLDDVHRSVALGIPVSDTLRGIITPQVRRTELRADVQEVAERVFPNVPIVNRGMTTGTSTRLVLHPPRADVMLRGGARDLSKIDPASVRLYVQIVEGVDTLGVVEPRLLLPSGLDASAASIKPSRVRYVFRRESER